MSLFVVLNAQYYKVLLVVLSHLGIFKYKERTEKRDYAAAIKEEQIVYRACLYTLCTPKLALNGLQMC